MYAVAALVAELPSHSPRSGAAAINAEDPSRPAIPPRQHRASIGKRLSGRPGPSASTASLNSVTSLSSLAGDDKPDISQASPYHHSHFHRHRHPKDVISKVTEWLQREKEKRTARRAEAQDGLSRLTNKIDATKSFLDKGHGECHTNHKSGRGHAGSPAARSDTSLALEELEQILVDGLNLGSDLGTTPKEEGKGSYFPRRGPTRRRLLSRSSTVASSDTDYQDSDVLVPWAEVVLDNSKTLGYSGGTTESQTDLLNPSKRSVREKEAWLRFKQVCFLPASLFSVLHHCSGVLTSRKEIVCLAHTLRLKGWRQVPIDHGGEIEVERLSGALTNAVYVVSPPKVLPQTPLGPHDDSKSVIRKRPPP